MRSINLKFALILSFALALLAMPAMAQTTEDQFQEHQAAVAETPVTSELFDLRTALDELGKISGTAYKVLLPGDLTPVPLNDPSVADAIGAAMVDGADFVAQFRGQVAAIAVRIAVKGDSYRSSFIVYGRLIGSGSAHIEWLRTLDCAFARKPALQKVVQLELERLSRMQGNRTLTSR